ncbi:hypothetical protein Tco_0856303 [Tanacetum coccineum]|uniref:Retrovirus-related Pol polyprotein from transposon TNT 1-94-like beta-barrel domain-containing protein n=1 Tax=Tanacetum coccineum TaxID=301880 RepID=A0ABQ5B2Z4_9ASTR
MHHVMAMKHWLVQKQTVFGKDKSIPLMVDSLPKTAAKICSVWTHTYDSDCDDLSTAQAVLMTNISNYGSNVISEDFEQSPVMDFTDNEISSDSNIIPYSQYLQETQQATVQDTNLQAQQDSMILSVIEQICHEKMIDSQMDDMIREKLALKEQVDSLEQNIYKQIKEKESLFKTFIVFKIESKEKENKYMENEIDLEKMIKELDNIICKVGQSAQTLHMLTKPQAFYDNTHKQALGYQNPFYLKKAQRIKPTLYDGVVMSNTDVAMLVIDDEETLILEEESRSKMSEKVKDSEVIAKKISHKPIDYEKLNRLTEDFGKLDVPSELLKVSLVNTSLKKLKFHLTQFDSVVKKRTTPNALDEDLLNEITEVQTVFDQMEVVVQQSSVDKQCLEIAKKEILLENDRLLQKIMSQDVLLTVMNSMSLNNDSVNMEMQKCESCEKCLNLDAELSKSKQAYNDFLKNYSQLEKHCISLEVSMQLKQEVFQNDESCVSQNAVEIPEYFEINDLKARLQDKDKTICKLKDTIKSLRENTKEQNVNHDKCELEPINKELENSVAKLLSENERLCNEINHVKQVFKDQFDSIKQTRVRHKEQSDSLINKLNLKSVENEDLKAQIQDKVFVITSLKNNLRKLKGKEIVENVVHTPSATTIAPGMFKLDLVPLPPRLLQNRDAHIDYLRHTQEQANTLQEIVEQAKAKQPLDRELDFACVVQIVLWYLDSRCSKHMTGNRSQLMNFVSKFLGSVASCRLVCTGLDGFPCNLSYRCDLLSTDTIQSLRENTKEENVNHDKCDLEPLNKELENSVAKLLSENERLCNEINHVKQTELQIWKEIVENVVHIPSVTTITPGMFKLDLVQLPLRLLQNRDVHIDYLRHTQEQANSLWELELLVYVQDTCPIAVTPSTKKVVVSPMNKVKKVRFAEPLTSSSNIKQVESSNTSDSNTPVLSSIGVNCSTNCGSKPPGNKKNDRISQTPSRNKKNKVEAQLRKVNKTNRVVKPICDVDVKHSLSNANSEILCATCNKSMFDGVHDKCLLDLVQNGNKRTKSAKKHKKQNIWKPTGHVFTEVGFKWKPTGRTFTIVGNSCPLTRFTSTNVVPPKQTTSHSDEIQKPEIKVYCRKPKNVKNIGSSKIAKIVESKNANHSEPNQTWGSNATDIPSSSSLVMTGTVRFGNDQTARIMGYGDYQLGNVIISRVYYVEGLGHNLFSVGQFCDADLEVEFRKNTCFIQNLEGVDLLSGSRDTNLYTISLDDMLKSSLICLLSKASKTKSWLWHR